MASWWGENVLVANWCGVRLAAHEALELRLEARAEPVQRGFGFGNGAGGGRDRGGFDAGSLFGDDVGDGAGGGCRALGRVNVCERSVWSPSARIERAREKSIETGWPR